MKLKYQIYTLFFSISSLLFIRTFDYQWPLQEQCAKGQKATRCQISTWWWWTSYAICNIPKNYWIWSYVGVTISTSNMQGTSLYFVVLFIFLNLLYFAMILTNMIKCNYLNFLLNSNKTGGQFDNSSCGSSKSVFFKERFKPWLFVNFNIIISHTLPENIFKILQVVQKL